MRLFMTTFLSTVLVGAIMVLALPGQASGASQGTDPVVIDEAVKLHAKAVVDADIVTLGDLFSGAGEKADTPVAYAPMPGKRAYFGARWLYRLARAYSLDWRPLSKHTQAVIERRSQIIGREEIKDAVLSAMRARGIDDDLDVNLANSMLQLHVPANAMATVGVEEINYDSHTNRFAALLSAPADDPNAKRIRITGHMVRMTEIPVLTRRVLKGDVISQNDIDWIEVPADRLHKDAVLNPDSLIGKTPIRGIKEGNPIRLSEIRRPLLVKKGDLVTLSLQSKGLQLTAQGKALEHGADGDSIRISNLQSSQVVDATVTGPGRVTVSTQDQLAMSQ